MSDASGYLALFYHDLPPELTAKVFLQAPVGAIADWIESSARKKGLDEKKMQEYECATVLPGSHYQRLVGYRELMDQNPEQ